MTLATVEVKYVNQPDKNPAFGSIKTADGTYYGVPKFMMADFQPGETYEIEYKTREFKGREYHTVSERPNPSTQTAAAVDKVMNSYPKAAPGGKSVDEKRHIFVCGAVNGATHGLGFEVFADHNIIRAALDNLVRAYNGSLLANPQAAEDMNDSIPY